MNGAALPPRPAAWHSAPIECFLAATTAEVVGRLVLGSGRSVDERQSRAWERELEILRSALVGIAGHVFLEFDVPRLGTRIDVVVVSGAAIVPIEFKVGATEFMTADREQVWDYALDLKNFHRGSHAAPIFPVLVATAAATADSEWLTAHADGILPPRRSNAAGLGVAIRSGLEIAQGPTIDADAWAKAPYQPTPTIVQAARALYARHSVESIARSDAGARNLGTTSLHVERVIAAAERHGWKALVLVTGVPGAGKTLVGLNIATRHRRSRDDIAHAVYLSGNGPLVKVLQEALTRDEYARLRVEGKPERKGVVAQRVKPFLQNVHHFRDAGLRSRHDPPVDHIVVFDEAQRAWDQAKTARFMKSRKNISDFGMSEPEFQLHYLDRHPDWAVAVCLVGGGQEIHDGEAGIRAWIDAVRLHFPDWRVFLSSRLLDAEYGAGMAIEALRDRLNVEWDDDLHLSVSMRSFRAERVSGFVKALLDIDAEAAARLYRELQPRYPLVVTRDLQQAKQWVRDHARGSERFGLVASSQAERLKPHAIDVRTSVDPVHWFLDERDDTRSSFYLEDAATEFQVQGLELDWVCVTWDADLRIDGHRWLHRKFHGSRWQQVHNADQKRYLVNAYRVLLTRARQGMVIFVPPGESADPTRRPEFYDETFRYLTSLGIERV